MNQPIPIFFSYIASVVGATIAALIAGVLLKILPDHPIALGLLCTSLALSVIFLSCAYWYWTILSYRNSAQGSKARETYNKLRSNLRGVNKPEDTPFGEQYRNAISGSLNGAALWFGDTNRPNSDRMCRLFGLARARPLWTAESYDRCLTLAFLYPFVSFFVFWMISGTGGPVAQSLGLAEIDSKLSRVAIGVGLIGVVFSMSQFWRSESPRSVFWLLIVILAMGVVIGGSAGAGAIFNADALSDAGLGVVAIAIAIAVLITIASSTPTSGDDAVVGVGSVVVFTAFTATNVALGVNIRGGGVALGGSGDTALAGFGVGLAICAFCFYWAISRTLHQNRVTFFWVYSVLVVMGLAVSPALVGSSANWVTGGPILLFFGVLVFVNAPMDWLTLGFTRALLWRGVERRGLSPFILGLVDIGVALFLLLVQSAVMIFGIQLFNASAMFGVRESIDPAIIDAAVFLNLADLLAGIANPATRGNPEYWWVYATLFSTLLPSWLHLLMASGCLVRGSTRLNQVIGQELPLGKEGEPLLPHHRSKLAGLLALQRTFGFALATTVFFAILWFVLFVLFPHILPRLLELVVPLVGKDWATLFVRNIVDVISSLLGSKQ